MIKKILLVGFAALIMIAGMNLVVNAESNESMTALKEKAMMAEKKAMELEQKLKVGAVKIKSLDDLDQADAFLPGIEVAHNSGPAMVIGPKGKVSLWMTLTAASQINYVAAPTSPYANWNLEGDVWGMKVKVSVMDSSATKLSPENATFKVGDRVSIQGMMKEGMVVASKVRNHSLANDKSGELNVKIQELLKKVKELCATMTTKPAICATL